MPLKNLIDTNFLEYASYVIKDRAIPDISDGLKPVQRRIFHSLFEMDDGKFSKVANIIGHCMRYHPHGDASIGDALVVLANKEYFIEKQGNFGNILTGDAASAPRYIEARLTPLAREVLFNKELTEYMDSYDGRNKEPVTLPVNIPVLLMLGAEGIAVGMATRILPHNFGELLRCQIACLKGLEFSAYPDFFQGGTIDVSEYKDGLGKIKCRAKIQDRGRNLVITEIPFSTNVESLIASIEDAARRGKIKISSINDFTTADVEIELLLGRGADRETTREQLYLYTDCEINLNSNIIVIQDGRPVESTVSNAIQYSTDRLVENLERKLTLELDALNNKLHMMTLEQIFIENRLYKKIEECQTYEEVKKAVLKGFSRFKALISREITEEDIETLLSIRIKRISRFDIEKHKKSISDIQDRISEVTGFLGNITSYCIDYIQSLIEKYAKDYPRKTKFDTFEKVDAAAVAIADVQVCYDKKTGYLGKEVKDGVQLKCTTFDRLLLFDSNYNYRIIQIPEKVFVGKLIHIEIHNKEQVFNLVYSNKANNSIYIKRFKIKKYILEKEYSFLPKDQAKLECFSTQPDMMVHISYEPLKRIKKLQESFLFDNYLIKGVQARGTSITSKKVIKLKLLKSRQNQADNIDQASDITDKTE